MEDCPHHWIIDDYPRDGRYNAKCQRCGKQKQFPADIEMKQSLKRESGHMFRDRGLMDEKAREYERRKPELIDLYLESGSHFKAARAADPPVPLTTMRNLVSRWQSDGSIQKRQQCVMGRVVGVVQREAGLTVTFEVDIPRVFLDK